ncbi:hypothetical protein SAY86_021126, partial [Trapa natans]
AKVRNNLSPVATLVLPSTLYVISPSKAFWWCYLIMGWQCFSKICNTFGVRAKYGALLSSLVNTSRVGSSISSEKFCQYYFDQVQSPKTASLCHGGRGCGTIEDENRSIIIRNKLVNVKVHQGFEGKSLFYRSINHMAHQVVNNTEGSQLNRDCFVQLWVSDKKIYETERKRRIKLGKRKNLGRTSHTGQQPLQHLAERWLSGDSSLREKSNPNNQVLQQPPPSQSVSGFLEPTSPEEAYIAPLLARSNLLITRDIEWANLVLGFEQENRYAIMDICYPQSPVGFIREQSNVIFRQLFRLRRPFVAYINDALGNELFRVRRPFWWITSSIYAEIDGKEVGVVHRRWHLWKRVYDLYLGNKQFAVVENPGFWNWTFTLKDINGEVLAQIDRDWRGIGFEVFTDAGQYVIQFGISDSFSKTGPARAIQELDVARPLTLSERAVALALAISLDNDYFSRHGGGMIPFPIVSE